MKRQFFFLVALIFTTTVFAASNGKLPEPKLVRINERVDALLAPAELSSKTNRGYMVNSTMIIGDKGVTLIDTGFKDEIGQDLNDISVASQTNQLLM